MAGEKISHLCLVSRMVISSCITWAAVLHTAVACNVINVDLASAVFVIKHFRSQVCSPQDVSSVQEDRGDILIISAPS